MLYFIRHFLSKEFNGFHQNYSGTGDINMCGVILLGVFLLVL